MLIGLALNYMGINAIAMLFWSAVVNGVLAAPLIAIVILLTGNPKVMGKRTSPVPVAIAGVDRRWGDDVRSRDHDWHGALIKKHRKRTRNPWAKSVRNTVLAITRTIAVHDRTISLRD